MNSNRRNISHNCILQAIVISFLIIIFRYERLMIKKRTLWRWKSWEILFCCWLTRCFLGCSILNLFSVHHVSSSLCPSIVILLCSDFEVIFMWSNYVLLFMFSLFVSFFFLNVVVKKNRKKMQPEKSVYPLGFVLKIIVYLETFVCQRENEIGRWASGPFPLRSVSVLVQTLDRMTTSAIFVKSLIRLKHIISFVTSLKCIGFFLRPGIRLSLNRWNVHNFMMTLNVYEKLFHISCWRIWCKQKQKHKCKNSMAGWACLGLYRTIFIMLCFVFAFW